MEPIINPWWIYFSWLSGNVGALFAIAGTLTLAIFLFMGIIRMADKTTPVIHKWVLIVSIVGIVIGTALPSQKTVLTMLTLSQVTPDNIEAFGDTGKEVVDYVIDKIEEIIEGDN